MGGKRGEEGICVALLGELGNRNLAGSRRCSFATATTGRASVALKNQGNWARARRCAQTPCRFGERAARRGVAQGRRRACFESGGKRFDRAGNGEFIPTSGL